MEHLFSRLFVPKTIHSHGGTFILGNERCMDHLFTGLFIPWNFSSWERMNHGPFIPQTIRSLEHSLLLIKISCETSFSAVPGLVMPKSPSSIIGTFISTSTGFSTSNATSVSGPDSTSGIAAELRSLRACDLRTIWWRSFLHD